MRALFLRARIASVRQGARRLAGVPPARPGLKARPAARMGRKRRAPCLTLWPSLAAHAARLGQSAAPPLRPFLIRSFTFLNYLKQILISY